MTELTPLLVAVLAFCAIAGVAFVIGQSYLRAEHLQRRLPVLQGATGNSNATASALAGLVARHFDEKRFGIDDTLRGQLRQNLVRAGYFRRDAINFYVLWRLVAAGLMPLIAYFTILIVAPNLSLTTTFIVVFICMGLGVIGPDAFVSRRQRLLSAEYRNIFPDFLDLLVVCVDAGLSLEAALDRVSPEMSKRDRSFGINLAIMNAEMRAGRSFVEALATLADRLMIAEAQSLLAILRQSAELGSDSAEALRVFGDELRDKRLLRAEEQANKLSVKMLVPLGLFIFPVVLLVVVLPIVVKMATVFLPAMSK
jgi:tight adherence protein C